MGGWTKGPWAVDPLEIGTVGDVMTSDGFEAVAHAQPRQPANAGKVDVERLANAHLIAAAPDLYAALDEALDAWNTHQKWGDGMDGSWASEARAALAKALGEA